MSYILDALKRADAERGRNTASSSLEPDVMTANAMRHPKRSRWYWASGLAAVMLIAGGAWLWLRPSSSDTATPPAVAVQNPAMPTPGAVPPAPPVAPLVAPPVAQQAPAPAAQVQKAQKAQKPNLAEPAPSEAQAIAPPPIDPMPGLNSTAGQAPERPAAFPADPTTSPTPVLPILAKAPPPPPAAPRPAPTAEVNSQTNPANTVPVAKPQSAPPTPPALNAAQRAGLPQIAVSGSSYSTNPAHRMLIANGQVLKEGQELSPGLTLESIGQRSAVFNQHGTRFNVNY